MNRKTNIEILERMLEIAKDENNEIFEHLRMGQFFMNMTVEDIFYIDNEHFKILLEEFVN